MATKSGLKRGEKILFGIAGVFMLFAIVGYAALETYRLTSDKQIFKNRTNFDLSKAGAQGHLLFKNNRCAACHRAMKAGTSMGGQTTLDGIGSRRSQDWIMSFLSNPEPVYKESYKAATIDHGLGKEAAYVAEMSEQERMLIATFLSELRADTGSSVAPRPPEGHSPFIESMLSIWAPDSWKEKYSDVRTKDFDKDDGPTGPKQIDN